MELIMKSLLVIVGTFSIIIGILGIFLPILPTTPFLLLAAGCYIRGSKQLYNWLISNQIFGEYIKNYRQGKGIPLKTKVGVVIFLWVTISSSIIFFVTSVIIRMTLLLIAVGVTIHILSISTFVQPEEE